MTGTIAQPTALHRAALALHALGDANRSWVLQALPADQQHTLHPLLVELKALGIPQDPGLLDELLAQAEDAPARPTRRAPLEHLEREEVETLARVLAAEPPRLAATLLGLRDWAWREDLLACLGQELAAAIRQAAVTTSVAPALQETLVAQVLARMQALRTGSQRRSLWHRARQWVHTLRRRA